MELIKDPTREGVLELASQYLEILEAYELLSREYEELVDEDLKETEETLVLFDQALKINQERRIEHKQAISALDAIRVGLGIEKGAVKDVGAEIRSLFVAKSKIDKRIAELIDGLLEMQARKGRVDIITKLVAIQKIKLCARGELVERKKQW
jgi:chromosome condensin MukBEF ATPase and DNA-binding subunit MukB